MDAVEIDGLSIAYQRAGEGPPLALVHGGLIDHREWERQLEGLSDAFTVVAWDAPGCGASSDPPETFRMGDYADVLAALIERLGLEPTHVLGLSWGSTLALELWRRRPTLVRSLVLTAAYAGWAGSLSTEEVEERRTGIFEQLERPVATWVRDWLPTLLTANAPEELRERLVAIMSDSRPEGIRPMIHAMAEADLRPVLPTITVPTLLLYGELDVRSPLEVAEEMHRAIPRSTRVTLPGVGHQSNLEAPDRFNDAVRTFLLDVEDRGSATTVG